MGPTFPNMIYPPLKEVSRLMFFLKHSSEADFYLIKFFLNIIIILILEAFLEYNLQTSNLIVL